jgi:hypothetical protein
MPSAEEQLKQELKEVQDKLKSFDELRERERRISRALAELTGKNPRTAVSNGAPRRRRQRSNIDREAIVAYLRTNNSPASAIAINKELGGVNSARLSQVLKAMTGEGVLSAKGERRARRYSVKKA